MGERTKVHQSSEVLPLVAVFIHRLKVRYWSLCESLLLSDPERVAPMSFYGAQICRRQLGKAFCVFLNSLLSQRGHFKS